MNKPVDLPSQTAAATIAEEARTRRALLHMLEDLQRERDLIRQTEESLRASELRFRQMAENIREVFWLADPGRNQILYISPAYQEIWGRSCESICASPRDWIDTIHPEDRERVLQAVQTMQASGQYVEEYRIVRPDGGIRWIRDRAFPVFSTEGKIYRIAGLAEDITGRKQAAEELRRSENLKGAILKSSLDCVITIDHEGKIIEFNAAAEATFGWPHEQALGKAVAELIVPPRWRDAHRRGFAHYLATGIGPILGKRIELGAIRADGTEFPIELAVTAVGETSKPMFTAFIRDITARKEADEKIKRLNRVYMVLSGISTLIVRVHDRAELFRETCRIAVEHGNFRMAWISLFDPATQEVTPVAWAGENAEEVTREPSGRDVAARRKGSTARAIAERRPAFNNDILAHSYGGAHRERILARGCRSQITLPLFNDQTVVGILKMYATEPNFFDAEELRLLTELVGNISFALAHIAKEEKIARLSRIQAVMSNINSMIVRVRDRQELFDETCRIAVEHGGFGIAWIGSFNPDANKITPIAWAGLDSESLIQPSAAWANALNEQSIVGQAIRAQRPVFDNDLTVDAKTSGGIRREAVRRGYRSLIALPLLVRGIVVGNLSLFAREVNFFTADEVKLLTELTREISFTLEHIAKEEQLNYLAYYDVLTGLANRRLFLERVAPYMRSAVSGGHKLALYLIDLERFKSINDTLGQPAGDALLRQVAEWLTRTIGDVNLLARVGADQFAVVLPEVKHEDDVARLLEKSLQVFLDHPFHLTDSIFRVAAKVGVALFPDDGVEADTLFRNAEAALKEAKTSGDRYLFYTQKMTAAVAGRLTLENQLRQALEKEEFVLYYQPKINLASGKVTSAEALIRWNDPRTGLVPPGKFIPLMEETGLIYDVGRWALRKAIADYLRWRAAGLAAVRIAVNVSALQLRNRGFVDEVRQVIDIDGHAAEGLELEITESMIMQDVKHGIAALQAIRAMAVRIALDDFGTGFSSLSQLSKLPVDTLKIDRSFVIDMTDAPQGLALVSTIITLAHALKLKVVAEGVETEEQSRLLRLLNCDEMQGFLFSKPVPAEVFEAKFLAPAAGT